MEYDYEDMALMNLKRIPAPLGLSEWETTDGVVYLQKSSALARQIGIEKKKHFGVTDQDIEETMPEPPTAT